MKPLNGCVVSGLDYEDVKKICAKMDEYDETVKTMTQACLDSDHLKALPRKMLIATKFDDHVHVKLCRKSFEISMCLKAIQGKDIEGKDYCEYSFAASTLEEASGVRKKLQQLSSEMGWAFVLE